MSIDHDDVQEILAIIDKTPAREVIVERGDLKVIIRRGGAEAAPATPEAPPAATAVAAAPPTPADPAADQSPPSATAIPVAAPLTGTFYRAPAPGAEPFVSEGAAIDEMTTLCILEVMKVMNTLKAPCAGTVVRIDAANESAVTAGQALMWVEPG